MGLGSTPCIDENTIGALFDHRLTKVEVEEIDAHVAGCSECRDLLCSMARLYASSSPSRALLETAALVDVRAGAGATSPLTGDQGNIRRLLALLGCERQVGRILGGKWRLDAVLGVGGMAEVYAATHLSNGRRAAIKLLRPEWLSRPNIVYRFLREGYVANRINHPGAVAILDDGTTDDGMPFLVLELLDGQTIGAHVRDRLPIATVLSIACEILDVLGAAHDQRIVHRDIKPENVLLTRDGAIKVLDFGIARMHELSADGAGDGRATQHGMMMGTPAYMPPEQARGKSDEIDARTDVWAVGATMFALLVGRPVHSGTTPNETLVSAMREPAPRLADVAPTLPPEICEIVDRALAFAREDRWPSARLMQRALRDVLLRIGPQVESWPPVFVLPEDAERRPKGRSSLLLTIGVVLSLVMTVAFVARARVAQRSSLAPSELDVTAASSPLVLPLAPRAMGEAAQESPAGSASAAHTPPRPHGEVKNGEVKTAAPAPRAKPTRHPAARHADAPPEPPPAAPPSSARAEPSSAPPEDHHPLDRRD